MITRNAAEDWLNGVIRTKIDKKFTLGRYRIEYSQRLKSNAMGRFGGGWNWELGFQASSSTVIFNLLVSSLRIDKSDKCHQCDGWAHSYLYKKIDGNWHHFHKECWEDYQAV